MVKIEPFIQKRRTKTPDFWTVFDSQRVDPFNKMNELYLSIKS